MYRLSSFCFLILLLQLLHDAKIGAEECGFQVSLPDVSKKERVRLLLTYTTNDFALPALLSLLSSIPRCIPSFTPFGQYIASTVPKQVVTDYIFI